MIYEQESKDRMKISNKEGELKHRRKEPSKKELFRVKLEEILKTSH
jgi:hypothetical protein